MKPQELVHHDFLAFQRSSRAMLDEIDAILADRLGNLGKTLYDRFAGKPHLLVIERPDLVTNLLSDAAMAHVKVLVHGARAHFSERPLNVGTVPFSQWDSIHEATCRLNPDTRVSLERPAPNDKPVRADRESPPVKVNSRRPTVRPRAS
jgi:hypothetical protein